MRKNSAEQDATARAGSSEPPSLGESSAEESIQDWLVSQLASRLELDPDKIDREERFKRYGLDSARATGLIADLSGALGRPLPPTLVWDYPTITELSDHLAHGSEETAAGGARARRQESSVGPIAIVGMACRFPKAADLEKYWRLLRDGIDAVQEVPKERWDVDAFYHPDTRARGKMSTRWSGMLDAVDGFDAQFFGISPREALHMDPQQRLMLELSWEALEDAGMPAQALRGSRTGVFVGVMWNDYAKLAGYLPHEVTEYTATGQDLSIISARVSYTFGFEGPSLALDTACSSSLVAIRLAAQSLATGDSDIALAGGVHLVVAPQSTVAMTKFGGMAPDGRSKAFDSRANGYVRGEGGGVVILKPLARALVDGDPIHAVIRGGSINNDGFSNGLTAPNPKAQEAMLRDAYDGAGIPRDRVHYVETHGTGTILGDPIEANALGAVLGAGRSEDRPLVIGSAKSNMGHLEAAAGVAGLMKAALSMENRQIPPSLHFLEPNPHIPFDQIHLRVQDALGPWPFEEEKAMAGVSSFGFGGTNCHLILEEFGRSRTHLLTLSGASAEDLERRAKGLVELLDEAATLERLCRTSAAKLSGRSHRLAFAAHSRAEAREGLEVFLRGEERPATLLGTARPAPEGAGARRPVFIFSGQGSQWVGMGRELLEEEPVFRRMLQRCDERLRRHVKWSLIDELLAEESASRLAETEIVQPVLFAFQVALAELWRSWGVEPAAVIGHSVGEIAAAHVAGALSLDQALRVAFHRGRLMQSATGKGKMAQLELSAEETEKALAGYESRLGIAAMNSPHATVISGETEALEELVAELEKKGVTSRRLRVDYAFHSPQMEPVLGELGESLSDLAPGEAAIPLFSTVTAQRIEGTAINADYWRRNVRQPVRFAATVEAALAEGCDALIEVSPHPVLVKPMERCVESAGQEELVLPTLQRGEEERGSMLESLGTLYVHGWPAPCEGLFSRDAAMLELPPTLEPESESASAARPGASREGLVTLSAQSEKALIELAEANVQWLGANPDASFEDVCYTSNLRRDHLDHRLALAAGSTEELLERLQAFVAGEERPGLSSGRRRPSVRRVPVFVFSGQGAQWAGMGRELLASEPVFAEMIRQCDERIRRYASWSLLDELTAEEPSSRLAETEIAQPAIFAVQVALAALWRSWGVEPKAVVGHSVGEIAAAQVAGALSLDDAVRVAFHRGRLMQQATGKGKMAQLELGAEETEKALVAYEGRLSVAAMNSPRSTVISGETEALEELVAELEKKGVTSRRLRVDYAFHSPQMEPVLDELVDVLDGLEPRAAGIPLLSTVTGEPLRGPELDAGYWRRNVRQPVRFAAATDRLIEDGHDVFLEISPHPVLSISIRECLQQRRQEEGRVLPSLRRATPPRPGLLSSLGALHVAGLRVFWSELHPKGGQALRLPLYPWQRERYWLPDEVASGRRSQSTDHPLLGEHLELSSAAGTHVWEMELGTRWVPYLADHKVRGRTILPAAACVEMALAAAETLGPGGHEIESMVFEDAFHLPEDDDSQTVQVVLKKEGTTISFSFSSRDPREGSDDAAWQRHASGTLRPAEGSADPVASAGQLRELLMGCEETLSGDEHYTEMSQWGLDYGPAFQAVEELWRQPGEEAVARLRLSDFLAAEGTRHHVHPVLLDASFQVLEACLPEDPRAADGAVYLPVRIGRVTFSQTAAMRPDAQHWAHAVLRKEPGVDGDGVTSVEGDVFLFDDDKQVVLEARGLRLERVGGTRKGAEEALADALWQIRWEPRAAAEAAEPAAVSPKSWLIFADRRGVAERLESLLVSAGASRVVHAFPGAGFREIADQRFELDPQEPDQFRRLLDEAFGDIPGSETRGVAHLWSLETPASADLTPDTLAEAQDLGSVSVLHLVQALAGESEGDVRLALVTAGSQRVASAGSERANEAAAAPAPFPQAALWGLGRTLALEHPELRCQRIDLSSVPTPEEATALFREIVTAQGEDEIALRDEERFVARLDGATYETASHELLAPAGERAFRLEIPVPGSLDNLCFRALVRRQPGPGEVEIEALAAGLNFRDVMKALDIYPGLPPGVVPLGDECAGRITAVGEGVEEFAVGDEVIALADHSFATHVIAKSDLVAPKPARLSFEKAATLPLVFLTAHYSLDHVGRLSEGERVLIHAAAGGVGLAAVQLAHRAGAEVFATAGSEPKWDYLRSQGVEHVMSSRNLDFAEQIQQLTDGRGVDVVLNSLSGDFITRSIEVLGSYGRFLEIGKKDIFANRALGLEPFQNNLSYSAIDVDLVFRQRPQLAGALLRRVVELVDKGELEPLPREVFAARDVAEAFRFMAQAKHLGKIIVSFAERAAVPIAPQEGSTFPADATYLVTGGLGGLGLRLAEWMVGQGARHLVLLGRSGASDAARRVIDRLEREGAEITVARADVARAEELAAAFADIEASMPPLRGVIHAAGVLSDGVLQHLDRERFRKVMAPKVSGAWNLHLSSREADLDFFVLFASVTGVLGSPGQGNYAAANAALDALAQARAAEGLPALSVDWGPWSEVGMAAQSADRGGRMADRGLGEVSPEAGLEALRRLLAQASPQIGVMPFDVEAWCRSYPAAASSSLLGDLLESQTSQTTEKRTISIRERLASAEIGRRRALLQNHLREQVAQVLRLSPSRIDLDTPLNSLGLDSLMTVELRNRLEAGLDVTLSSSLVFNYPTLSLMAPHLAQKMGIALEEDAAQPEPTEADVESAVSAELEGLSEEEAEDMLLKELENLNF